MNRLLIFIISFFFLNNCSLNENSRIWKNKKDNSINPKNIKKKIFSEKKIITQFNQELKLDLANVKINNKVIDNQNNYGFQDYSGSIDKIGSYKFSKLDDVNELNFKPIFLNDGLIFFDKKGSIIRYDNNQKVLWKKNHYSKLEKKLKPKLNFVLVDQNLLIADSISKYY